ncbi:unnamed protein product [Schistosoma curassoni]|uniref:Uncharacterized protein n=1 Tax=Schistosoma curassoni TaxID=6186 RepID=A0A183L7I9_9TREM|nr:unnamed protein product [Schistosoma curassoni]
MYNLLTLTRILILIELLHDTEQSCQDFLYGSDCIYC